MNADYRSGRFPDRIEAGDALGRRLASYRGQPDLLVLGVPRGGVPVAARVALALDAPLDVIVVRKLGVPGHEELAMGAITSGGGEVLNRNVIGECAISRATIDRVVAQEQLELERRERLYRGDRPPLDVEGRTVIIVDDGLATGATMRAAVLALRPRRPARLVVAVPVAPPSTCRELEPLVDQLVCIVRPHWFLAVGEWYENFSPTSDDEVRALLHMAPSPAVT